MDNNLISRSALLEELKERYNEAKERENANYEWETFESSGIESAMLCVENFPAIDALPITGDTSDGYHTFNELYHHRAVLFSVICNDRPGIAWKSKKHHDGTMYNGMFIVGIDTPEGQATYHYDLDPYWDMFHVREVDSAPEWDGHTPDEAIRRIGTLTPVKDAEPVQHGEWILNPCNIYNDATWVCSVCGNEWVLIDGTPLDNQMNYCPKCGARMDGGKTDVRND